MENKKPTLGSLLLNELKNTSNEFGSIYYYLFAIMGENFLTDSLDYYYKLSKENPVNWFAAFHKSIRQTDYFQNCAVTISVPTITEDEKKELEQLSAEYLATDKALSKFENELLEALPSPDDPTYNESYKKNYVETYRAKFREHFSQDKIDRRRTLIKKLRNTEQKSINGHLDSILWLTIANDLNAFLYLTIDHVFNEYDYLKKHQLA